MNVRLTEEVRAELQRLADANKRTLSDYIRLLLEEHIETRRPADGGKRPKRTSGGGSVT